MRLLEWQGREILAREGIPVPEGRLVRTPEEAKAAAEAIGGAVVLKAQVLVGGRGKAGGIRVAQGAEEAGRVAAEMLGSPLRGMRVTELLVVKAAKVQSEHYLGITVDRSQRMAVLIYSPLGGVEIEEIARTNPEAVRQAPIPPLEGLSSFRVRRAVMLAREKLRPGLSEVAHRLYRTFCRYEAMLLEINPLAETEEGLLALDAKVIVDDNRHPDGFGDFHEATEDPLEAEAKAAGLSYVGLDGQIGVIGNGAGLVMATLDLVARAGGRAACFLDIGGGARAERVKEAVELATRDGRARVLFINVFGGITRCDEVARGILAATERFLGRLPVVVRLTGTNEGEGRRLLEEAGLMTTADMEEGAARAVALAKESA